MKTEELEKIFDYLIGNDIDGLFWYCQELKIISNDVNDVDILYDKLTQIIEKDDDLMIYFKEYAKINPEIHVLIPYFQKPENIRYFVENLQDISMTKEIYNEIEDSFRNRNQKKKDEITQKSKKINKFIRKYGVYFMIIFELIAIILAVDAFKPFVATHILKTAEIADAIVVEQQTALSFSDFFTTNIDIKYTYNVNGTEYTNEEHTFLAGIGIIDSTNKTNKIKVYYNKKNPQKCHLYKRYATFYFVFIFIWIILFLVAIIKSIKLRKQKD